MPEKKKYRVLITETLQKAVVVEAASEQEAHQRAEDAWQNAEVILGDRDFAGAEFHVTGEADTEEGLEELDRKE